MSPKHKFKTYLKEAKRIWITTHLLPDGDGLGAETALFHYLKKAGKSCKVYNPDPLPRRYRFLDPKGSFIFSPGETELRDHADLWVIIDTNDPARVGSLWPELSKRASKIIFLDHHEPLLGASELHYPPHALVVSDPESSSIGELLYALFEESALTALNRDIALGLYVSVMTDTNSFRYARTTPASHEIAAKMIELGVNPEEVYQAIYSSKEVSHLQLLGKLLQDVRISKSGKIAWLELPLELRKKHKASADDTLSFLNLLLLIREVEVICLFREEEDGRVRASIKSKGRVSVHHIAMEFGGGGHEFASGLSSSANLKKTVKAVITRLEKEVQEKKKT